MTVHITDSWTTLIHISNFIDTGAIRSTATEDREVSHRQHSLFCYLMMYRWKNIRFPYKSTSYCALVRHLSRCPYKFARRAPPISIVRESTRISWHPTKRYFEYDAHIGDTRTLSPVYRWFVPPVKNIDAFVLAAAFEGSVIAYRAAGKGFDELVSILVYESLDSCVLQRYIQNW